MDIDRPLAVIGVIAIILLVFAFGVWAWQNASDKRACRRSGGTVVEIGTGTEWHCVGPIPDRGPR